MLNICRRILVFGASSAFISKYMFPESGAQAQGLSLPRDLVIASVSWIDGEGLPDLGTLEAATALISWPNRVTIGLVATQNPRPSETLPQDFKTKKHFRALTEFKVNQSGSVSAIVLDGGYTPPVDKSKVPLIARPALPTDPSFYSGEKSALSSVIKGELHPSSGLKVPDGHTVIASALIKFRAGKHTNDIGVNDANSPYHVPWVWCEYALVKKGNDLRLIANGSRFPSHAWYVNGRRVGILLQDPVKMSEQEPAYKTGLPKDKPFGKPEDDKAEGAIKTHPNTLAAKSETQISINL